MVKEILEPEDHIKDEFVTSQGEAQPKVFDLSIENKIRADRAEKAIEFIDRANCFEFTKDLMIDKTGINFKQFKDFLIRINGIVRDIPIKERSIDGQDVQLTGFVENALVPKHEDKEELLEYTFKFLKDIKKEDWKYLMPAVINSVHLFKDGNGRTSRTIYQLFKNYSSEEQFQTELRKALGGLGRYDTPDISPRFGKHYLVKFILEKNGWEIREWMKPEKYKDAVPIRVASTEFRRISRDDPNYENIKKFSNILESDWGYIMTSLYESIGEKIKDIITKKYKDNEMISPEKMVTELNYEDWQQIFNRYYAFKKEEIKLLVRGFINPDSVKLNDQELNFRDYFIKGIEEDYDRNKLL